MKLFRDLLKNEAGATAIEYGLLAALIAVAAMAGMKLVGKQLDSTFTTISTDLKPAAPAV